MCSRHYQQWRGEDPLDAANRLGGELRKALAARGRTTADVARGTGLQHDGIGKIIRGLRYPTLATLERIAAYLDWPELLALAEEGRRRTCIVDGRQFVTRAKAPEKSRFCGSRCQTTYFERARRGRSHDITAARLKEAHAAIATFCFSCEPVERMCRDARCPLRDLSPLPLIVRRRAP
jgi:Helix-turn-helix domain